MRFALFKASNGRPKGGGPGPSQSDLHPAPFLPSSTAGTWPALGALGPSATPLVGALPEPTCAAPSPQPADGMLRADPPPVLSWAPAAPPSDAAGAATFLGPGASHVPAEKTPSPAAASHVAGPVLTGGAPSFAQVLLHSLKPQTLPIVVHPPAFTDSGEPAAFFTLEEITTSCKPLQSSVIARTAQGRPPFSDIRAHLVQRFKLQQDFMISALDNRHLLIRFQNNDDFLKVLLKETMYVQGRLFRFFRWSFEFRPDEDSPVISVWLELPHLPANLFSDSMVRSIAGSVGPVLQIDRNTQYMIRTQSARVHVQLDVSRKLPDRIWVGYGAKGFWQPIVYPEHPLFCSSCKRLGHLSSNCKKASAQPNHKPEGPGQSELANAKRGVISDSHDAGQAERKVWRPVHIVTDSSLNEAAPMNADQPPSELRTISPLKDKGKDSYDALPHVTAAPIAGPLQQDHQSDLCAVQVLDNMPLQHLEAEPVTDAFIVADAAPMETSEHDAASGKDSSEPAVSANLFGTPQALNAAAPAWRPATSSPHSELKDEVCLLDDPKQFAIFLETAPAKASPSFSETKRGDIQMMTSKPPPPCFPAATSSTTTPGLPQKEEHGYYKINLPELYNIRSVPSLETKTEEDNLLTMHNAWAGRTRSTTILTMDSDGEYEDFSD
ncbi:hypothetical protein Taro_032778 [Colocasia esculenta]|uniref:DUF4283 domain-containing protein n=1 Tax=Colocasia esculenta TaxID=4460 RepID=A0A843VVV7_COLES|nr:hypothetical protein [Colocasia esculenta]